MNPVKSTIPVCLMAAIAVVMATTPSLAMVIDFSSIDAVVDASRIKKVGPANFSYDITTEHPDGFHLDTNGTVENYYGEAGEFITFDYLVDIQSIDIGDRYIGDETYDANAVVFKFYDSSSALIDTVEYSPTDTLTTVLLNETGVQSVVFDFTGGDNAYSDGRLHAWYSLDNIVYEATPVDASAAAVPLPATLPLFGAGIGLIGMLGGHARRARQSESRSTADRLAQRTLEG
jgi:hypothetical protein